MENEVDPGLRDAIWFSGLSLGLAQKLQALTDKEWLELSQWIGDRFRRELKRRHLAIYREEIDNG